MTGLRDAVHPRRKHPRIKRIKRPGIAVPRQLCNFMSCATLGFPLLPYIASALGSYATFSTTSSSIQISSPLLSTLYTLWADTVGIDVATPTWSRARRDKTSRTIAPWLPTVFDSDNPN